MRGKLVAGKQENAEAIVEGETGSQCRLTEPRSPDKSRHTEGLAHGIVFVPSHEVTSPGMDTAAFACCLVERRMLVGTECLSLPQAIPGRPVCSLSWMPAFASLTGIS